MTAATRGAVQSDLARRLGSAAEARWLVEEVLGRPAPGRPGDELVPAEALERLEQLSDRRLGGEPLQQVVGHWSFRTLDLALDARVLVPRPETEQVVEVALAALGDLVARHDPDSPVVVVDLGTGSGAIALAVAAEAGRGVASLRVLATDVDPDALTVAAANRERVGAACPWVPGMVELRRGDWWSALPEDLVGRVDLAISNPPYVSEADWVGLATEVRDHEPRHALVAGPGSDGTPGLAALEAVLGGASRWLARPGTAVVELSPEQAEGALAAAERAGCTEAWVAPDLAGRPRALVARFGDRGVGDSAP